MLFSFLLDITDLLRNLLQRVLVNAILRLQICSSFSTWTADGGVRFASHSTLGAQHPGSHALAFASGHPLRRGNGTDLAASAG